MTKKIVLAYSGGLDSSVLLKWIKDKYQVPVLVFVADIGQGGDMSAVSRKASKAGCPTRVRSAAWFISLSAA